MLGVSSNFDNDLEQIKDSYPQELINAFGGAEQIAKLPVLDLGENIGASEYIDFVTPKMMSAQIMRGKDKIGRPFISFCVRIGESLSVETIFRRDVENKDKWAIGTIRGCSEIIPHTGLRLIEASYDYLTRLVQGKPCGMRGNPSPWQEVNHGCVKLAVPKVSPPTLLFSKLSLLPQSGVKHVHFDQKVHADTGEESELKPPSASSSPRKSV
ncbi:MAG: hypothetical protein AB7V32_07025 [Candidatus Berkiella sp.]